MKKKKLIILLKAGKIKLISYGHLYRCIELAKKLKNKYKIIFFINNNNGVKDILKKNKFNFSTYKKLNNKILLDKLSEFRCNKIIIDLFTFANQTLLNQLEKNKIKVILIDDFPNKKIKSNTIFNYNIDKKFKKKYLGSKKIFFGPEYLPITDNLKKLRLKSNFKKNIKKITIFFGGSDIKNLSENFINIFNKNYEYDVSLILGPGNSKKKFQKLKKKYKNKKIKIYYFVKNLDLILFKSDLIICSGGYTMYKAFYLRKLCLIIPTSLNERKIFNFAKKSKIIANENYSKNFSLTKIKNIISNINKRVRIYKKLDKLFHNNNIIKFYDSI